jgi:hypothetical protein
VTRQPGTVDRPFESFSRPRMSRIPVPRQCVNGAGWRGTCGSCSASGRQSPRRIGDDVPARNLERYPSSLDREGSTAPLWLHGTGPAHRQRVDWQRCWTGRRGGHRRSAGLSTSGRSGTVVRALIASASPSRPRRLKLTRGNTLPGCHPMVRGLTNSSLAISGLDEPSRVTPDCHVLSLRSSGGALDTVDSFRAALARARPRHMSPRAEVDSTAAGSRVGAKSEPARVTPGVHGRDGRCRRPG